MRKVLGFIFVSLALETALDAQNNAPADPAPATSTTRKNILVGDARSLLEAGRAAEEGRSRPQSYTDARGAYEQAAQLGSSEAHLYLWPA